MNNQHHEHYQAITESDGFIQKRLPGSRLAEMQKEIVEDDYETLSSEKTYHIPWMSQSGQGSIAYELLLLQQRLDAYEQLHVVEMAELRQEIERLRRSFLQETNPQMHILTLKNSEERE